MVNANDLFVIAEANVEDAEGRHIAQGVLHSCIERVQPPPPPPPETMPVVYEPVYDTPDPYLRSLPSTPLREHLEKEHGLTIVRDLMNGNVAMPVTSLYGIRAEKVDSTSTSMSFPASEWFATGDACIAHHVIAAMANLSAGCAGFAVHEPGFSIIYLDSSVRFLRPVPADGRRLRTVTEATELAPNRFVAETRVLDTDGALVALHSSAVMRVDAARRLRRTTESTRVLATLLFTDIVGSTAQAESLGDIRWRALLEQYRLAIRRELSRLNGMEVDSAGDGFFVRFDSPAQAVEAARAAVRASARLGIAIRAGSRDPAPGLTIDRFSDPYAA